MSKRTEKKKIDSKELLAIKEGLRKKIEAEECFLFDVKTPSKVWKQFQLIKDTSTGASTGYVRCMKCKGIHKHDSAGTGTSHLNKHLEICGPSSKPMPSISGSQSSGPGSSSVLTSYFKKSAPVTKIVKKEMLQGVMGFCSFDMRPFEAVKGRGLEFLIEKAMMVAVKYGLMPVKETLPDPTTVSRNIKKVANELRARLVPFYQSLMQRGLCAATTDMWTDDYKRNSYTTVTLQYTDSDWNLVRKVLFTCGYPEDKKKTADHIREELVSKFTSLGFNMDVVRDNVTFVTDQGPNIVKALQDSQPPFQRLSCCAHLLNTILRNVFKLNAKSEPSCEINRALVAIKALVGFLKHSGLSSRLKTSVHQEIETRWNSRLAMVNSVYNNFEDINALLSTRPKDVDRLNGVNLSILMTLITFLEPFKAASDLLEADGCTINLVYPEYLTLLNFCNSSPNIAPEPSVQLETDSQHESEEEDAPEIASLQSQGELLSYLKAEALKHLRTKFIINNTHKLATLLTPITKDVGLRQRPDYSSMSFNEREEIIEHLRDAIREEPVERGQVVMPILQPVSDQESLPEYEESPVPGISSGPQPLKKQKLFQSPHDRLRLFVRKSQFEAAQKEIVADEVSRYLEYNYDEETDYESDVLQWWRKNHKTYPALSNLARKLFSIPASSASSERVFSAAGYIVGEKRSSLSPEAVDAILFLNSNAQRKDFIANESDTD